MKGKVIISRPDTTIEVPAGTELVDESRQFYTTIDTKVFSVGRFTRFMQRIFSWWPWGRSLPINAVREDRLPAKLRHKHPRNRG